MPNRVKVNPMTSNRVDEMSLLMTSSDQMVASLIENLYFEKVAIFRVLTDSLNFKIQGLGAQ